MPWEKAGSCPTLKQSNFLFFALPVLLPCSFHSLNGVPNTTQFPVLLNANHSASPLLSVPHYTQKKGYPKDVGLATSKSSLPRTLLGISNPLPFNSPPPPEVESFSLSVSSSLAEPHHTFPSLMFNLQLPTCLTLRQDLQRDSSKAKPALTWKDLTHSSDLSTLLSVCTVAATLGTLPLCPQAL